MGDDTTIKPVPCCLLLALTLLVFSLCGSTQPSAACPLYHGSCNRPPLLSFAEVEGG